MAYEFDIKYRKTSDHGNADAFSRLPTLSDTIFDKEESCLQLYFDDQIFSVIIKQTKHYDKFLRTSEMAGQKSYHQNMRVLRHILFEERV